MRSAAFVFLSLLFCGHAFAQLMQTTPIPNSAPAIRRLIDGTTFLKKQYKQSAEYFSAHPQEYQKLRLPKLSSWGFVEGSAHQWWTYSYVTDGYHLVSSTCRKVGTNCYIFVEDSLWTNRTVTQSVADSIENNFDHITPANPHMGIFAMDTSAFGSPPDIDGDPRIIILICDIGGYAGGFFDPSNEYPGKNSNTAEIYYVDASNITTASVLQYAMSTAAHEFQHMINFNYHLTTYEPTFVDEGCAMLAEVYCGYPTYNLSLYANETNTYLFGWRDITDPLVYNDYARAQRFFLFVWDRLGIGIFKTIVQSQQVSVIDILNNALSRAGTSLTFNSLFTDWLIANELNDTTVNPLYGYAYPGLPVSNGKNIYNPTVSGTDTVQNLAAEYFIFKSGSTLNATFTNSGGNANLSIVAIEIGSNTKKVIPVPFNTPFSEPDFGTLYSTITFVLINKDPNRPAAYTYQVRGNALSVVELKWDTLSPRGTLALSASDTVCVTFDACLGGTLDSVRVALLHAGSITGGIYQYTGVIRPTPLGRPLAVPVVASIATSTSVPYPVPYKNWAGINLTSMNIRTDQPFAVAFVIGSVPSTPGVMYTVHPGSDFYHSYSYLRSSDRVSSAGWYYFSSNDSTAIYLIRAYISFPTTGVKQSMEIMPNDIRLYQNYPNPFNPSTTISYELSVLSNVKLTVYDMLGREVGVLVDGRQNAGRYQATWNAAGVPSGVYFYRLQAGSFIETKKIIFMR
jgi:hypothetical protein